MTSPSRFSRSLSLCLLVLSCSCSGTQKPPKPETGPDLAGNCEAAATFLSTNHCPETRADFKEFCVYEVENGALLRPSCIALSHSCEEAAACR